MTTLLAQPATWLVPTALPLVLALMLLWRPWHDVVLRALPLAALPALLLAILGGQPIAVELPYLLLGAQWGLDPTARVFLLFSSVLWIAAGAYTRAYLGDSARRGQFAGFFLATMCGNLGLLVAHDAASFYLFFSLMSFASYGLVIYERSAAAVRAARVYLVLVVVGEVFILTGLLLAASAADSTRFADMKAALVDAPAGGLAAGLLFVGLGIKAGALPLHVWLPLAHPAAATPASAILSGALIKAGLVGWLRLIPWDAATLSVWGDVVIGLGLAAAYFGVLVGVAQRDAKSALAYSSISQMGLITVALGAALLAPQGWTRIEAAVALYALHHGLAKGALFLGVGVVQASDTRRARRWTFALMTLPALALCGLPGSSGAAAKLALKGALPADAWGGQLEWLLTVAALGTTLLMGRLFYLLACGTSPQHVARSHGDDHAQHAYRRMPGLCLPWAGLIAVSFILVWTVTWIGGREAVRDALHGPYLVALVWPVALGAAVSLLVAWLAERRWWHTLPAIPPGDWLAILVWLHGRYARWKVARPAATWPNPGDWFSGQLASAGQRFRSSDIGERAAAALEQWPTVGVALASLLLLLAWTAAR